MASLFFRCLGPSVGRFKAWEWLDTQDLKSSKAVFTHMPGRWRWLSSETKLRRWPEHLHVVSPCGVGFLTIWPSQGTRCLHGVSGLQRWVSQESQLEIVLLFICLGTHMAELLLWSEAPPPQIRGSIKVTSYEEHMVRIYCCGHLPSSLPDLVFLQSMFPSPHPMGPGSWLTSQAVCYPFIHHRGPHNQRHWSEITL